MIEGPIDLCQAKVWARFTFPTPGRVRQQSDRFVAAVRALRSERIDTAPSRHPFPAPWRLDLQAHPRGRITFVRRTDAVGAVRPLGRSFAVDPRWPNRMVRAECDLDAGKIRFCALRRKEPTIQPMVREIADQLQKRKFRQ
jgi:hypothetical protein